ncbi:hypothetical protein [Amycolatopsis australiensis]|uniref:Uncharacterized protein n=1 Tax=Amycolatopsis australiensis TaxID=546364 RepID=A0A1K1PS36_9PSEU|nr:hypothetical protein [Amycolatopsis australiensis]SFW50377.1 hypothetical protein SAMN04489730_0942 [Amycolatopsis australiensis]
MTTPRNLNWLDDRNIALDVIQRYKMLHRKGIDHATAGAEAVAGVEDAALAERAVAVYRKNLDAGMDRLSAILWSVDQAVPHPSHDAEERWEASTASGAADARPVVPEGFESVEDVFDYGYCHGLALALHEETGWPLVQLEFDGDELHYLVRRPDGMLVDAHGARPEDEVRLAWSDGSAASIDRLSVRDCDAGHLWGLVRRGDMEDPNDVRDLARHVITERGLAAAADSSAGDLHAQDQHERGMGAAVNSNDEHARPAAAGEDVEVVVINPAELMPAEDALRNYDIADDALGRFVQLIGEGWSHDEAAARAVDASQDETGLAADTIAEYRRHVDDGMGNEAARSAAVTGTADRYTPRVSAETAQQIAAALAEYPAPQAASGAIDTFQLGDVVRDRRTGEVFTVTGNAAGWDPADYDTVEDAPGPEVPERVPEPGSWIDRNLSARGAADVEAAAPVYDATGLETDPARVQAAVNSLPAGVVTDADLEQAGITRDDFNRVTREQAERVGAEEQAQLDAEHEHAAGPGDMAEYDELERVRAAVDSLGDGAFTDEDLARVGVTPEQLSRLVDADMDRDAAEYRAEEAALLEGWVESYTADDAREVLRNAEALDRHMRGCHIDVSQCGTCNEQEHDSSDTFWNYQVPAARRRLAQLDADASTGGEVPERRPEPDSWIARNLTDPGPSGPRRPGRLDAGRGDVAMPARADEVLGRIDEVLGEEAPLGAQVAECGQAVTAAESAVQRAGREDEDTARGERCARWNAEDAMAEQAVVQSEGWVQA